MSGGVTDPSKFYEFVFVKNPNNETIGAIFKTFILETTDVTGLFSYEQDIDSKNRKVTITYRASTTFGEISDTIPVEA